jgi:cytochrome c oxidase subunit IV
MAATHHLTAKTFTLSFLVLLALTAASLLLSFLSLGAFEFVVGFGIATIKAAIVVIIFMHLIEQDTSHRLIAVVGFVFIVILTALTAADVLTREPQEPPHGERVWDSPGEEGATGDLP